MFDAVGLTLRDLHKLPKYKWPEIYELGVRWRDEADEEARVSLIKSVLPLSVKIAQKWQNRGLDLSELISLAYEGVIRGVDTFDPDKGRLTTHASNHIIQKIRRGLIEDRLIHIPSYAISKRAKPEIAEKAAAVLEGVVSIDASFSDAFGEENCIADTIDSGVLTPLAELIAREDDPQRILLYELIDSLPKQQKEVMLRRSRGETLDVAGAALGLTRERIRQIETEAVIKLKQLADRAQRAPKQIHLIRQQMDNHVLSQLGSGDRVHLVRLLDTLTLEQISEAIDELNSRFEESKAAHTNNLKSLTILKRAIEARDGIGKRRPAAESDKSPVKSRRGSNLAKIIDCLKKNGPSSNKTIITTTGVNGSSVSAVLSTQRETFTKNGGLWDLTAKAKGE